MPPSRCTARAPRCGGARRRPAGGARARDTTDAHAPEASCIVCCVTRARCGINLRCAVYHCATNGSQLDSHRRASSLARFLRAGIPPVTTRPLCGIAGACGRRAGNRWLCHLMSPLYSYFGREPLALPPGYPHCIPTVFLAYPPRDLVGIPPIPIGGNHSH